MQTLLNFADPTTARSSLFMSTHGEPFTTSRAVAERFGKQHKNVLKRIKKLLNDVDGADISQRNFAPRDYMSSPFSALHLEPRDYTDDRGKTQLEYKLTHDGFALLVMGFTGKEALAWKIAFLTAFNQLEAEAKANRERFINALDLVRPALRPVTVATEHGQNRAVIAASIGKSVNAVTYHRNQARKFGLLAS